MDRTEVAVIGGGPVGSWTAAHLARYGHEVTVLEEHGGAGRPVQCAGLVSHRVLDQAESRRARLREVRGAILHGPAGERLEIRAPDMRAVVIDRSRFDREAAERAMDAGASFRFGLRATRVEGRPGEWTIRTSGRDGWGPSCDFVVGADGAASAVAARLGLPPYRYLLPAAMVEAVAEPTDTEMVEVYVGEGIAPGFFGWVIPAEDGRVRIGTAIRPGRGNPRRCLDALIRRWSRDTGQVPRVLARVAGSIPLGLRKRLSAPGGLVVGDAAGMVKPTSGGGLHMGLTGAVLAAKAAHLALANGPGAVSPYDLAVREVMGKELQTGMRLYRGFSQLDDRGISELLRIIDDEEIIRLVVMHGDIDYPSMLWRVLWRKAPRLVRFTAPLFRTLFAGGD